MRRVRTSASRSAELRPPRRTRVRYGRRRQTLPPPWVSLHAFYTRAHKNTWLPALCPVVPCLSCQPACTRICGRQSLSLPHIAPSLPPPLLLFMEIDRWKKGAQTQGSRPVSRGQGEEGGRKIRRQDYHGTPSRSRAACRRGGGTAKGMGTATGRPASPSATEHTLPPRVRLCLSMKPVVLTVASSEA